MPERLRLVSLDCPNCGGKLPPSLNAKSLHCGHCNRDIIIDWGGRISAANCMALAKADFILGDRAGAETEIRKALETNPDLAEAWFWKGLLTIQLNPSYTEPRQKQIAECLKRSQLTSEEAVTSLVDAGGGAADLFYSTSLSIAHSMVNWPKSAAALQKNAGTLWYAASLLEAFRRLDPEAAVYKSTEIINWAIKYHQSQEAQFGNRHQRDYAFRYNKLPAQYREAEEIWETGAKLLPGMQADNFRTVIPLVLGVAYHLGPQNHERIEAVAPTMLIGEKVENDLAKYNLAVEILTFPPRIPVSD